MIKHLREEKLIRDEAIKDGQNFHANWTLGCCGSTLFFAREIAFQPPVSIVTSVVDRKRLTTYTECSSQDFPNFEKIT